MCLPVVDSFSEGPRISRFGIQISGDVREENSRRIAHARRASHLHLTTIQRNNPIDNGEAKPVRLILLFRAEEGPVSVDFGVASDSAAVVTHLQHGVLAWG